MKVALVHDWLTNFAGAEQVLLALHEMYPEAPIYTTSFNVEKCAAFREADVRTSFIQKLPWGKTKHQLFLPVMPLAFESFDMSEYDVVISITTACAKGIITKPGTLHICYCNSPMRYAWEGSQDYIQKSSFGGLLKKLVIPPLIAYMRIWDRASADRVDVFIGNSKTVARRIKKYYHRDSTVIYPPVNLKNYQVTDGDKRYYFFVSRHVPYKRTDLVVGAFNELGLPVIIAGTGPEVARLKKIAKENVRFVGYQNQEKLSQLYTGCKAFIFPPLEDFGIVPVEAMACGRPVIAYGVGGATETVVDGKTGILFPEQTVASLVAAVRKFEEMSFDPVEIRAHAMGFDVERFKKEMSIFVEEQHSLYKQKEQRGA